MDIVKIRPRRLYELPEKERKYIPLSDLKEHMEKHVERIKNSPKKEFEPYCYYNEEGNMFELYWKDDMSYSEQCGNFRVMKSFETGEIVGVTIHNVFGKIGLKEVTPE